jgi:hypothetical protein
MSGNLSLLKSNRLVRIAGRDKPAAQVMQSGPAHLVQLRPVDGVQLSIINDYAQIDLDLQTAPPAKQTTPPPPQLGVGYAGMTPAQRGAFLDWLAEPTAPAPPAFQQLYLAQLEVNLLEGENRLPATIRELRRLGRSPAWHDHEGLMRATILAHWLLQDGAGLAEWSSEARLTATLLERALGCQALLQTPLQGAQLAQLLAQWLQVTPPDPALCALRVRSLTSHLDADPLAYVLARVDEAERAPRPWRTSHRDLRLLLPQPPLRRVLEPLLRETISVQSSPPPAPVLSPPEPEATPTIEELGWRLILEFGHSRSDLFSFALILAQRQPGFVQLLDEDRHVVYRVIFKRSEMRQFWRLWDYVQSWANTHVYLNGQELEKWKVYPYSQFLR